MADTVVDLDARRIERALAARSRYRYVRPRVVRDGAGYAVLSANCSRSVLSDGGEIPIARLQPQASPANDWLLLSRDHAQQRWCGHSRGPLHELLRLLAADPSREFWL